MFYEGGILNEAGPTYATRLIRASLFIWKVRRESYLGARRDLVCVMHAPSFILNFKITFATCLVAVCVLTGPAFVGDLHPLAHPQDKGRCRRSAAPSGTGRAASSGKPPPRSATASTAPRGHEHKQQKGKAIRIRFIFHLSCASRCDEK